MSARQSLFVEVVLPELLKRATAEVGGDIAKVGQTLMTQYAKQQDMQQDNAFQISASKLEGAYATSYEQAKHEANPDGSNFDEKLQEIVAPQVQDILANGPTSGPYADKLSTANEVIKNKVGSRAQIEKISMLEQYNANGAAQIGDTFADSVRENPSPEMIDNRTKTYNDYLDDKVNKGIFTPETRDKLMQNFNGKLGMSYVEGLANRGSYGQAVNTLRANQTDPSMMTNLEPAQAKSLGLITQKEADQLTTEGKTYDLPVLTQKDGARLSPALVQAMNAIDPLKKSGLIDQMKNKAEAAELFKVIGT